MGNFYERLSYSFGNEDWRTEHKALGLTPEDTVLCITASGDRALNLLSSPCASVTAIDANPVQNALFDLKKAALGLLDYDEYVAFLGLRPMKDRISCYERLRPSLDPLSDEIWQKNRHKIRKGVVFQGTIEKLAKVSSTFALALRRKKIEKLFSFDSVEEQSLFVAKEFDTALWRQIFPLVHLFRRFLKDPGLYQYVSKDFHVGRFIHGRITHFLTNFPARESLLMSLLLRGRVDPTFLPPYMDPQHIPLIKNQLDKVHYKTVDLLSHLKTVPECSYDKFSLSDVASYIPKQTFEEVLYALVAAAKPGARFCIRQFMTNYQIPDELAAHFKREPDLEERLGREDNCFVYHFLVGKVVK